MNAWEINEVYAVLGENTYVNLFWDNMLTYIEETLLPLAVWMNKC